MKRLIAQQPLHKESFLGFGDKLNKEQKELYNQQTDEVKKIIDAFIKAGLKQDYVDKLLNGAEYELIEAKNAEELFKVLNEQSNLITYLFTEEFEHFWDCIDFDKLYKKTFNTEYRNLKIDGKNVYVRVH